MATTARKTTAPRKTAASKTTKPAPDAAAEVAKVEETPAAETPAPVETTVDTDPPTEAPAPADTADETPADTPSAESDPTSDEADDGTPAEETVEEASSAEPALSDFEKATNATELAARHAIAESGNVPGAATTPIRSEAVNLEHAPLDAPKPKAEEQPAQPVAAETQFADVAAVHLKARPDADVIDEATGKAPVAPLFSEPVFGIVTSNYRLLETGVLNGRVVKRLLVAQHTQLSTQAAAKIEAYVADLNADLVDGA